MTKKLPKENSGKSNSDQKISLYNIIKGRESEVQQKLKEEKDKDKEKETKKETSNLYKDNNYSYSSDEHNKWISVSEITRCGCEEEDKLIKVLNDVYNIAKLNIALIAGSSAGGLTGAVGIGAIGFFVFKKVVSVSATAATVATVAL
ncbi:hypothetical protein MACK_003889 [Theileria orientalis]|uniref:Uncharacterized protein n=1 Tax=Theileria orientalis TaxID=68886 RepID=A0A976SJ81_THEOR|nr:hypothetical protein MACK_003889 [Theileria orientalis]